MAEHRQIGESGAWKNTSAGAGCGDALYLVDSRTLYAVSLDGTWSKRGTGAWDTRVLCANGTHLFAFENGGGLYRIEPGDGSWTKLTGDWKDTHVAAGRGNALYAIDGGTLYSIEAESGTWQQLGTGRWSSRQLCAVASGLVSFEADGSVYAIDPKDGSWRALKGDWKNTRAATGAGANAYAIDGGKVYAVDPVADAWQAVGASSGWKPRCLISAAARLFDLEEDGTLYEISV